MSGLRYSARGRGVTDILDKIDETLTFYSAGLGAELQVPVERGFIEDEPHGEGYRRARDAGLVVVIGADLERLRAALERDLEAAFCRAVPVFCELALSGGVWLDEHLRIWERRDGRLRRMRHLYRTKRRHW